MSATDAALPVVGRTPSQCKEIRLKCERTQTQVGAEVGVGQDTIGDWEAGRSAPRSHVIRMAYKTCLDRLEADCSDTVAR